jgi:hypothetical protein
MVLSKERMLYVKLGFIKSFNKESQILAGVIFTHSMLLG